MRFGALMNSSDLENSLGCSFQFKGYAPFDGPFVIMDEHNPYCELFAKMYTSYQREFEHGERDYSKIEELEIFLERMFRRECNEEEFRQWVTVARWRVESGKEDKSLRAEYLRKFPEL
jgi:hypothetical protein